MTYPTSATSGAGVLLQRGDAGAGSATQASKLFGTVNQQLKILAKVGGVAGNSMQAGIVVAGISTVYSQVITKSSVLINAKTDGSQACLTKVGEAIANLYADATFQQYWQANQSTGDASGLIVAGASANLTGGVDGGEAFTTIGEVKTLSFSGLQAGTIDVTTMESQNNTREFIPSLIDGGDITFTINFLPGTAGHKQLVTDMRDRVKHNYKVIWPDSLSTPWGMSGYVTNFAPSAGIEDALTASVTIKLVTFPTLV